MRVLDAVAVANEPVRIDPRAIQWDGEGEDRRAIVDDVEHWLWQTALSGQTFVELGVPWAHPKKDRVIARANIAGADVALYRNGQGAIPTSSPRPVLHPVRTLSGVVLTANHPADHDWHSGVGMAIPDVNGTHFWGGGTYVHGQGYVLLDNHGVITGEPPEQDDDALAHELKWTGHDGSVQLREHRSISWAAINEQAWRLSFDTTVRADAGATLNSPGSKGRIRGGYGGFWAVPRLREGGRVYRSGSGRGRSSRQRGAMGGLVGRFRGGTGSQWPATIIIAAPDAAEAGEPWFVRVRGYPGLGSALAWDQPVLIAPGAGLRRRFTVAIADGRLGEDEARALAADLVTQDSGTSAASTGLPAG